MRTTLKIRAFSLPELVVSLVCGALLLGTVLSVFSEVMRWTLVSHGAAGADRAADLTELLASSEAPRPSISVSREGIQISVQVAADPASQCTYRVADASGALEARLRVPPVQGGLQLLSLPDPMVGSGASGTRFRYLIELEREGRQ